MPTDAFLLFAIVLLLACTLMLALLLRRQNESGTVKLLEEKLNAATQGQERAERALRDEIARSREEAGRDGHLLRGEVTSSMKGIGDTVFQHLGTLSNAQQEQLGQVLSALQQMSDSQQGGAGQLRTEMGLALKGLNDSVVRTLSEISGTQKQALESFSSHVASLTSSNGQQLEALRASVEGRLDQIRSDNAEKLERVRQTVDEKLQGVLEQRLGESFRSVSERLEQVHRGLGEMQTLASGVGDLKKVLSNVKVRGTWGEMQLGSLLAEVLAPEQYAANVATNELNGNRVEFAIRLPGHDLGAIWLPIDAKFPVEDYQRLVDAQESGDPAAAEGASRQLEQRIRQCARDICTKYICPPSTTDFGIMFLPTEGLYAEVVRRPGLLDTVQRESRVVVAGPITLWAILNSLQMGFRTLAIQQRSSEVWSVLGAVKTEFTKFGSVLEKVKKKLQAASNEMDRAGVRTRQIERKLRAVEELPSPEAQRLLPMGDLVVSDAEAEDLDMAEALE
jgi:DNA recombination protein RmuC